ncbi:aldo/keto reductase [Dorea formicigenerans]|uniref:Aldo/keto reductase n=2 Tax=Dorea formicigenerans TaxID=39486 RepID=A0A564TGL5_9FIRM|nr:aldo/keto reductase [Dorea formicigenerans]MCI5558964.1 aldo/keto reductase [Dorea formicigenerans]MDD7520390.1 aldo/keto reductase [Dorea formicigenerans]NME56591.1 aldo/keto reductase [Dorea formicigenerans]NSK18672.1 aldo/keto reductase [Dorea formicigenerans]VUX06362.1 General stress protein 69 [Dorea formicigenerans]
MQYQEFGKTGLRVSKLCLGTWGIGGAGWDSYSDESRMDAIKAALECGINFIDTAPAYNAGKAECYVGETLNKLKKRREVVISTKCGNKFVDGKYLRCGSKESILKQCDESLKNLKTDYIDIYLVHWPDPDVELEETIDAVSTLKKEGKILHAGVSNFSKEQIEEAQKYCKIEAFQPQYSLADRKDEKLIRWAYEQGLGIMTYGTLGGGILTGNYRKLRTFEQTDSRNRFYPYFKEPLFSKAMELLTIMDQIAEERNVSLAQIAEKWVIQKRFVSSCIIGAQSRARVEENCRNLQWELTDNEIRRLESVRIL